MDDSEGTVPQPTFVARQQSGPMPQRTFFLHRRVRRSDCDAYWQVESGRELLIHFRNIQHPRDLNGEFKLQYSLVLERGIDESSL